MDDIDSALVYSNSGPRWWSSNNNRNGGGHLVDGRRGDDRAYMSTWHESLGDGATVSFTFTGTSVTLLGTICTWGFNTTVNFYLDGQHAKTFAHIVPGPQHDTDVDGTNSDVQLQYTMGEFNNLPPTKHTIRAVFVGADSLFVVDAFMYEPSEDLAPSSSSQTPSLSTSSSQIATTSTISGSYTTSTTRSLSTTSTTSRSSVPQPTIVTPEGDDSQPMAATMDVPASDSRIVYTSPDAWDTYRNARRATSCLEGTMSSSTAASYLTYNFTGTTVQVHTIYSSIGANYSISIDGQDKGTYSTYDPAATDPSTCSSSPLYSVMNLLDMQHTLVLTVLGPNPGPTQNTIQFVGFRLSSVVQSNGTPALGSNIPAIVGGVIGGFSAIFLILLVIWVMRRQQRMGIQSLASEVDLPPNSAVGDDPFHSAPRSCKHLQSQGKHRALQSSTPMISEGTPVTVQSEDTTLAPPPPVTNMGEKSTALPKYYTLPSYQEKLVQCKAVRNLSEADLEAVSGRLREEMVNQTGQLGNIIPPQELIEHLVEEWLHAGA